MTKPTIEMVKKNGEKLIKKNNEWIKKLNYRIKTTEMMNKFITSINNKIKKQKEVN